MSTSPIPSPICRKISPKFGYLSNDIFCNLGLQGNSIYIFTLSSKITLPARPLFQDTYRSLDTLALAIATLLA